MPLGATKAAILGASDASGLPIQRLFNASVWTGNETQRVISTGVNLGANKGAVFIKCRDAVTGGAVADHMWFDTVRGPGYYYSSNNKNPQIYQPSALSAFTTNGFQLESGVSANRSGLNYVGYSLRAAPKFFDVVTYIGDGSLNRRIPHSLGVNPGAIIVKNVTTHNLAPVYHRMPYSNQAAEDYIIQLDSTNDYVSSIAWNDTAPTSTYFTVNASATFDSGGGDVSLSPVNNVAGYLYVAYLFAHDTSSTGKIQCGQYDANVGFTITTGWDPQLILIKRIFHGSGGGGTSFWTIFDSARGFGLGVTDYYLRLNTNEAENNGNFLTLTGTGFSVNTPLQGPDSTYNYIAIRGIS